MRSPRARSGHPGRNPRPRRKTRSQPQSGRRDSHSLNRSTGRIGVKIHGNTPAQSEHVWIRPSNLLALWDIVENTLYEPGICPICRDDNLNAVMGPDQNAIIMDCCGKECCIPCFERICDSRDPDRCPMCRADTSDTSNEAHVARLRKRAESGEARAAHNPAVSYDYGTHGLPRDEAMARKWYAKAAPNHPTAVHNLGISH